MDRGTDLLTYVGDVLKNKHIIIQYDFTVRIIQLNHKDCEIKCKLI